VDLLEHQGKQLLARHGLSVPAGALATSAEEAQSAALQVGCPCAVKAQVRIGGRGKLGGVRLAETPEQAAAHARAILGMEIRGLPVRQVWVERAARIADELYASILFDRGARAARMMLCTRGGVDIEQVAAEDPSAIASVHVDPLLGFQDFHGRLLAFGAGVPRELVAPIGAVLRGMHHAFVAEEAMLIEINPLIVTDDRQLVALDAKVTLDGNALYRHPDNAAFAQQLDEDPQERMAKERGLTSVKLDGEVGILGNGAGLVMSTLDVVAQAGGRPANFLDAGGGSKAEAITAAVQVILSDPKVRVVLFNIFGGITRCDEVARGLIEAFRQLEPQVPFVVRLDGTNDEEGRRLLADAALEGLHVESTMDGAARRAVQLSAARAEAIRAS
jgi:succinyl-CoA synthetase beta subunit